MPSLVGRWLNHHTCIDYPRCWGVGTLLIRVDILGNEVSERPKQQTEGKDLLKKQSASGLQHSDSAAGGCKETKGAGQAVLPLRGKIKNCTSLELSDAIKSDIIKDILTCLGCGIGDHFNINNLRYNRIIILTDADADGRHIEILLLTLFLHHLPELIKQGKVYAAVSPLYRTINGKEVKYWYEDNSEFKKYMRNHKNVKLTRFKGLGELSPDELYETTLNPSNRLLIQLTTENVEETLKLYDELMGKSPALRREFILKNKLSNFEISSMANAKVTDLINTPNSIKTSGNDTLFNLVNGNRKVDIIEFGLDFRYKHRIHDYFTKYGYKVNKWKYINVNSRKYFNFIKTNTCNIVGENIPREYLEEIKDIFNRGLTIWHIDNGATLGDYSVAQIQGNMEVYDSE